MMADGFPGFLFSGEETGNSTQKMKYVKIAISLFDAFKISWVITSAITNALIIFELSVFSMRGDNS